MLTLFGANTTSYYRVQLIHIVCSAVDLRHLPRVCSSVQASDHARACAADRPTGWACARAGRQAGVQAVPWQFVRVHAPECLRTCACHATHVLPCQAVQGCAGLCLCRAVPGCAGLCRAVPVPGCAGLCQGGDKCRCRACTGECALREFERTAVQRRRITTMLHTVSYNECLNPSGSNNRGCVWCSVSGGTVSRTNTTPNRYSTVTTQSSNL